MGNPLGVNHDKGITGAGEHVKKLKNPSSGELRQVKREVNNPLKNGSNAPYLRARNKYRTVFFR